MSNYLNQTILVTIKVDTIYQKIQKYLIQIYRDYDNSLGARKVRYVLERDYGVKISLYRVNRLIQILNLPKRSTEKSKSKTHNSFQYLCIVIDLFSRKVIGWSLSNRRDVDLTIKAFEMAYIERGKPEFVLFHSDQGSEYTAFSFRKTLENCNAVQSFSKKGYPYDNAVCECFFRHMKRECLNRKQFRNQKELQRTCAEYISRYNSKRPHNALGKHTPNEIEEFYNKTK